MTTSLASELFPAPDPAIFPTLTGRQEPHHLTVWPGDDTHGFKAITLADRISQPSMPWQCGNLRAILRRNECDKWTHPNVVLLCPRQNGKSEILLLRCLYGLFKLGEKILYTVQRWSTGKELHERLVAMINARPSLRRRLAVKPTNSQGRGTIILDNGAQMVTTTRSADMARGLTKLDLVVFDEAYNLDSSASSAVNWAQMAAFDPQTIYTSSAVNTAEHPKGEVLAGLRRKGLSGAKRFYFAEYMAPPEMADDAVETWEYANPSYGVIQTAEKMQNLLDKVTSSLERVAFGVEGLGRGVWPTGDAEVPAVIAAEVWKQNMTNPNVQLVGPIALALDMTPDRELVSIALAQRTNEGRIHLEVGYHERHSPALLGFVVSLIARWDPCALVIDKASPAYSLAPDLLNLGIEAEITTDAEMVQACGGFYDDALAHLLDHTGDPLLADALADASKRYIGGAAAAGGWAWNRKGESVISPLVAATLARWGLTKFGTKPITPPQRATSERKTRISRNETANLATVGF